MHYLMQYLLTAAVHFFTFLSLHYVFIFTQTLYWHMFW